MLCPAFFFWVQNNLQVQAAGCITANTVFITYQMKTIWAILLSIPVFGRWVPANRWIGLAFLLVAVVVAQQSTVDVEHVTKTVVSTSPDEGEGGVRRRLSVTSRVNTACPDMFGFGYDKLTGITIISIAAL